MYPHHSKSGALKRPLLLGVAFLTPRGRVFGDLEEQGLGVLRLGLRLAVCPAGCERGFRSPAPQFL